MTKVQERRALERHQKVRDTAAELARLRALIVRLDEKGAIQGNARERNLLGLPPRPPNPWDEVE